MFSFLAIYGAIIHNNAYGFNHENEARALDEMKEWSAPENPYSFALVEYPRFKDGSCGQYRVIRKYTHNPDGTFTVLGD